jgi:hypothetical protein
LTEIKNDKKEIRIRGIEQNWSINTVGNIG